MVVDWVAPVVAGAVGIGGIAGTVLTTRLQQAWQARSSDQLQRLELLKARREERKQAYLSTLAALTELHFSVDAYMDESAISNNQFNALVKMADLRVQEVCLVGSEPTSDVCYEVLAAIHRFNVLAQARDREAAMEHYPELLSACAKLRDSMREDLDEKRRE
ncbi:hypothetical protein [Micromonospora chalcea]|uniref:hypothetical protein n=1 Tax=Micromonospora chalcea TaxID=1874 RepID=UPI0034546FF1